MEAAKTSTLPKEIVQEIFFREEALRIQEACANKRCHLCAMIIQIWRYIGKSLFIALYINSERSNLLLYNLFQLLQVPPFCLSHDQE